MGYAERAVWILHLDANDTLSGVLKSLGDMLDQNRTTINYFFCDAAQHLWRYLQRVREVKLNAKTGARVVMKNR